MPSNNYDPLTPGNPVMGDRLCPRCGTAMEPIGIAVEGLPIEELQLCPECYLVTWSDQHGLHFRQGLPVKKGGTLDGSRQPGGEPKEC